LRDRFAYRKCSGADHDGDLQDNIDAMFS